MENKLTNAIKSLTKFGAIIESLPNGTYWVEDNGIWGLLEHQPKGMIFDSDELIELCEQYCGVEFE